MENNGTNGVVKISIQHLLAMEHDYIRNRIADMREKAKDCNYDEMVLASEFAIFAGAVNDFVEELIGDADV